MFELMILCLILCFTFLFLLEGTEGEFLFLLSFVCFHFVLFLFYFSFFLSLSILPPKTKKRQEDLAKDRKIFLFYKNTHKMRFSKHLNGSCC